MDTYYFGAEGCVSHLTDGGMGNLAAALPRSKILQLGRPCRYNSCDTTVASLLLISTHCLYLAVLEVHFNTLTIAGDMQHPLSTDSERDRAKCELRGLMVGYLPLGVSGEDFDVVVMGLNSSLQAWWIPQITVVIGGS